MSYVTLQMRHYSSRPSSIPSKSGSVSWATLADKHQRQTGREERKQQDDSTDTDIEMFLIEPKRVGNVSPTYGIKLLVNVKMKLKALHCQSPMQDLFSISVIAR